MTRARRAWRANALTWGVAAIGLVGLGVLLYPMTAQWVSSYNQAQIVTAYDEVVAGAEPDATQQLADARRYNEALSAGAVLAAGAHVPAGTGVAGAQVRPYAELLRAGDDGLMSRIRYDALGIDLPVYHGTSDEVLLRGAGHLEGTSLPVGGADTHAVITAHRGLANATMFSHLDQAAVGDVFTVETFGEVLSYRVADVRVVEPEQTDTLRASADEDLVTLVTCTPLGINTHRILVTGERIPTAEALQVAPAPAAESEQPGFPWWALLFASGLLVLLLFVIWSGFGDARATPSLTGR